MTTLKALTVVSITVLLGAVTPQANETQTEKKAKLLEQPQGQKHARLIQQDQNKIHRNNMIQQLNKLNLTEEQKEMLKAYGKKKREERENAKVKLLKAPTMGDFVTLDGFDKEAFIHSATGNAKHKIISKADSFEYTISILTVEQRATLISILKEEKKLKEGKRYVK